ASGWPSCCRHRSRSRHRPLRGWERGVSPAARGEPGTAGSRTGECALAYAEVAGLPVQYGLYSSFVGCFVYCLLGTAKDVTLGPTAIMSLLVSSYAFHDPAYAVLLAFLSGCIQLAMGLLHLGFLLDFVSCPVIKGFTSAASITISFNQVKNILGLQGIPRQFFLQVYETLRRIGETRVGDAILGLSCLAALAGLRAMKNRLHPAASTEPLATRASILLVRSCATARNALVVLAAGLVAYSFQVSGSQPLTLTGSVPCGLPPFRPPPFSKAVPNGTVPFGRMVQDMGAGLAVVPLLGVLETVAIAKAFASQNDYRIDANQELLAMGAANILGSFFSSYPITGSFGRTAVNAQTGVCTPMGGLVTGTLVLLSLAYLTSLFCYIPKAALAAVIISAVVPMFDARIFRTLWRVKRLDLIPLCMQYGIMAGMLVSGILLLYSVARPPIKQGVLLVQPGSSLHFPAADHLRDIIRDRALAASSPCFVILDGHHVSSIDYTAVVGLAELLQDLHKHSISLVFCSLQDPVLRTLLAADLEGFRHFPSWEEAGEAALRHSYAPVRPCPSQLRTEGRGGGGHGGWGGGGTHRWPRRKDPSPDGTAVPGIAWIGVCGTSWRMFIVKTPRWEKWGGFRGASGTRAAKEAPLHST
uniref:Solute carrier family 26 member 11 n=1 Tax=Chrysolophus pictus TaxID=9089 RepID=A0A8C3KZF5_CHRPC